jgi:hypothetical protein
MLMAKREINLEKLVINNYTTEEVLSFCIDKLAFDMDEEKLGDKYIYWKILEALEVKLSGRKSTKIL